MFLIIMIVILLFCYCGRWLKFDNLSVNVVDVIRHPFRILLLLFCYPEWIGPFAVLDFGITCDLWMDLNRLSNVSFTIINLNINFNVF